MIEGGFPLKGKCVATSDVFGSVKECVANQSHIVPVSVHLFCICSEKLNVN